MPHPSLKLRASFRLIALFVCWTLLVHSALVLADSTIESHRELDFGSQIRPILAEKCLACHGVDEQTREGGLRLDLREAAIEGGDSGVPAIVTGQPENSQIIQRVTSQDEDEVMPPPHSHLGRLTGEEIELLEAWIMSGAEYTAHWAFVPPTQETYRRDVDAEKDLQPVDYFVQRKLSTLGLAPSPKAADWQLCRRLYLDLIGLPPSPDDLEAFERDGFSATVEKLLASERFGEKWARVWLDAARYSDTNGYEKDLRREQWAWRDWVIQAFNADMPYDQFIIEQIAGDLLPNSTQDQMIATGMLRNSMINEEGAIVPEEFRMAEMFDRIDCVGKAVLGISTQCAQCHSHKFDPLTHDEYFGMFAYLNNSYEAQSWVYNPKQLAKIESIQLELAKIDQQTREARPDWSSELEAWCESVQSSQAEWLAVQFDDMNSVSGLNHPTQEHDLSILMLGHKSDDVYLIGQPELNSATGLRIELLCHDDLPFSGPGRNGVGGWDMWKVEVFTQPPDSGEWQQLTLVNPTADFSEPESTHDEGKKRKGPVEFLVDGSDDTAWRADRGLGRRNAPSVAVLQFEKPLEAVDGTKMKVVLRMSEMVGCCRISLTRSPDPKVPPVDYAAQLAMRVPASERSEREQASLLAAWRKTVPELKQFDEQVDALNRTFPVAKTSVLHLKEREPVNERGTRLLNRGEWNRPAHAVPPHVPAALHKLPESEESPRLQFARWLVDRRSPLAARVAVNRIWQSIFGMGLVETSEDFGTRTPMPEYRDLLDWLSVDMMENNWSTKLLIRRIVCSHTYQQSSQSNSESMASDPDNRLLARGPRFRADAEVIRDMAMAVAGLIHHEVGGPSIIPPVPQNVLDYNYVYPGYWKAAEAPQRYRRTVYNFRKRSMPDPAMSNLDSPNGDFACVRRIRSNTPLAALTGLNEPIFVESAQGLALRVLRESSQDDRARIDLAYQLCMTRVPSEEERMVMLEFLGSQRKRVAEGWVNAKEIATGKIDQAPDLPDGVTPQDAAVWTIAARVLLNLDETICKN